MKFCHFSIISSILILLASSVAQAEFLAECEIRKSIYRDVDDQGFELVFDAVEPPVGSLASTISINYFGSRIYQFDIVQGSGYGSFFADYRDSSLLVNFFAGDLASNNPSFIGQDVQASEFMFISGLGSFDYYQRNNLSPNSYPPLIGDTVWVFDRCQ
jgi:hypothetical protein